MRRVWHQVDGKLVPGPSPARWRKQGAGLQIITDIAPYKTTAGRVITSRAAHRNYLRERGAEEVGNEKAAFFAQQRDTGPSKVEMEQEVRDAIELCRAGKGQTGKQLEPDIANALDLTQAETVT